MRKMRFGFAGCWAIALVIAMTALPAAAQEAANFVGTWDMTMTGGGGGGQGGGQNSGQGGGQGSGQGEDGGQARGGHHGGGGPQSLTIAKDGEKYTVTHKTPRGDNTSDGTVSGNTISWTEQRTGRNGDTMKIDFKATLDGDALKGTVSGGRFNREFTAKRSS
ncbi:MAG: hypothetical protein WA211_16440 [Candidatus Acidiferrales bacterium]